MGELKLKFDATLDYQGDAVAGVVDLFTELPLSSSQFSLTSQSISTLAFTELGVGNPTATDDSALGASTLANLRAVQERNDIPMSEVLDGMNFSVEMETGTGKTYVYLRTVFELNKRYGFTKFVVVVPNIAIREGVLASIELLRDHLRGLYDNVPFDATLYDSKHLGRVRQFATANTIQLLVMNIQAFQKDVEEDADSTKANIINRAQDRMSGRRPIEFIQATKPVVIIDEPQNMESEAASAAIVRLNPFCTLRYSATHRRAYNRVYRLGPVDAYDMNLVKRIEVASVVADENPNAAFVRLVAVDVAKARAQVTINHGPGSAFKARKVWVKSGDDLAVTSGGRQEYADGWIVSDISFRSAGLRIDDGQCWIRVLVPRRPELAGERIQAEPVVLPGHRPGAAHQSIKPVLDYRARTGRAVRRCRVLIADVNVAPARGHRVGVGVTVANCKRRQVVAGGNHRTSSPASWTRPHGEKDRQHPNSDRTERQGYEHRDVSSAAPEGWGGRPAA